MSALSPLGIVAVVALSWAYLWTGAGIGMSALEMTAVALSAWADVTLLV